MALRYFRQTAAIDLADTHVAIDGGVHIAALGGVWLTAVFGFAGLSLRSDGVAIDPQLPTGWSSLGFGCQWRGRRLKIRIDQSKQCLEATLEKGEPMTLVVSGTSHELRRNQVLRVSAGRPDRSRLGQQARRAAIDHKAHWYFRHGLATSAKTIRSTPSCTAIIAATCLPIDSRTFEWQIGHARLTKRPHEEAVRLHQSPKVLAVQRQHIQLWRHVRTAVSWRRHRSHRFQRQSRTSGMSSPCSLI